MWKESLEAAEIIQTWESNIQDFRFSVAHGLWNTDLEHLVSWHPQLILLIYVPYFWSPNDLNRNKIFQLKLSACTLVMIAGESFFLLITT